MLFEIRAERCRVERVGIACVGFPRLHVGQRQRAVSAGFSEFSISMVTSGNLHPAGRARIHLREEEAGGCGCPI
jgi:hypothetical protein